MVSALGFNGTSYHQLDDKGRVRIPSKFLQQAGADKEGDDKYVVTLIFMAGSQGCISVYPPEALAARLERMRAVPEQSAADVIAKRKIRASMEEVTTDKQGRVVLPPTLKKSAKINRDLVSIGMDDHFEIWAKEVYEMGDGDVSYESAFKQVGFF